MKDLFLLDVDDTLLDFHRAEREQLLATLHAHGIAADEGTAARFHVINDGLWKALERGETTRERLVVERFEILLGELGVRGDAEALSRTFFEGMPRRAYAFEGAADFLRTLAVRGRVYAVTNGAKALQRRRIAAAGLAPWFSALFISEEVGHTKPSPAYAGYVLSHIPHFDRGRAVYVGDSLTSDMVCANTMDVDFILYRSECPAGYRGLFAPDYKSALALIDTL
mgnify:FL=1